jgi:lipoprotein NlpD
MNFSEPEMPFSCLRQAPSLSPRVGAALMLALALAACQTRGPITPAPVETRVILPSKAAISPSVAAPEKPASGAESAAKPAIGAENAGKPGYYTVRGGDTLIHIALAHGQSPRDLARWNALENPNRIEVGQVLRVAPPAPGGGLAPSGAASAAGVETRPLDPARLSGLGSGGKPAGAGVASPVASAPPTSTTSTPPSAVGSGAATGLGASPAAPPGSSSPASATPAAASATGASRASGEELSWRWPSDAPVIEGFDEKRNLGIDLGGQAGDPILAMADGRVIWVGEAPRLGKVVIIKHMGGFLSAYAHNQKLLVEENSAVRQGQKIAEMGSTDAERVKLHFEIRKDGKPQDPLKFLPPR